MTPTQAPSPTREDGSCSPEHVEAILRRVDALPTLSPIATRVLQLSGSDESDLREIARLVQADPSLSAKLLALCRRSNLGLNVTTVERAVVVLGLDAVRAAVLSISVFELMRATGDGPEPSGGAGFDRRGLWMHSVAAACAAEMIAERLPAGPDRPEPAEAFVCGLLHDLGKIALDLIIPKSFARIVEVCDRQRADFARVARRVVGMDHHVVGKRLGEHWGLPLMIRDAMWLHGQSPEGLPGLPHDGVLRLVIAGDRLAQRLRLGWSGEHEVGASPAALLAGAGLERPDVEGFTAELHERVERHALALGLMREDDPRLLARALASANEELGRMSELLDRRARRADASAAALLEIEAFLDQAPSADGLSHTLELVGRSAERVTGARVPGVLWQRRREAPVELVSLAPGRGSRAGRLEGPAGSTESLADALSGSTPSVLAGALAMAAAGSLGATERAAGWSLHPVAPGNGSAAAIILEPGEGAGAEPVPGLEALTRVWAAAIVAAARYDGAQRLGERLAEANAELVSTQARLVEDRSMERLAVLAAGAAHEMNTPLAVISGNAQLLLASRKQDEEQAASRRIVEAAEKLSDLISALHFFADPPAPAPRRASVESLVWEAIADAMHRARDTISGDDGRVPPDSLITPRFEDDLPAVRIDVDQIRAAITEVLLNAIQSPPSRGVEVRVQRPDPDGRLLIEIADDGVGMDEQTRARAFDPFFSDQPAGRRTGLGLTRARRLVELQGGDIELSSEPGEGTIVRIALNIWRPDGEAEAPPPDDEAPAGATRGES
jgi:signal transduction histidine kinase/HD-like signal output (HDOD) protein